MVLSTLWTEWTMTTLWIEWLELLINSTRGIQETLPPMEKFQINSVILNLQKILSPDEVVVA